MQSLQDKILKFCPDTLDAVRKEFNLDKPGRMDEAIDILDEWVQKQSHFVKKDYRRDYLERIIITTKGSIERAKTRIDKLCTLKTLMPHFFTDDSKVSNELFDIVSHGHLPQLTEDNYRIYLLRMESADVDSEQLSSFYKNIISLAEYLKDHEYCVGFYVVLDYRNINVVELATKVGLVELRQVMTLFMEGYGLRIRGIHVITPSKMVDGLITIFKQVLSEKVAGRIYTHKTLETLFDHVPMDIFPKEYGGKEKSLKEINLDWIKVITAKEHMEYLKEMNKATTDESCRRTDKFNEHYIGMPGSFRTLSVD